MLGIQVYKAYLHCAQKPSNIIDIGLFGSLGLLFKAIFGLGFVSWRLVRRANGRGLQIEVLRLRVYISLLRGVVGQGV